MARILDSLLDRIQVNATDRRPGYRVEIWDIRTTGNTVGDVVRAQTTGSVAIGPNAGPRDFSGDVVSVQVEERRGDYVSGGIAATSVTLSIVDQYGVMDPIGLLGLDPESAEALALTGRFLRKGNVVVIYYGDVRVDSSLWPRIFTGQIVGQSGYARGRSDGPESRVDVRALGREAPFLRYTRTSSKFSSSQTWLQAAGLVAEDEMGLDIEEYDFSGWGSQVFGHKTVQFVEETPLAMLARLMFVDGFLPRFNGDGVLTQISTSTTSLRSRAYQDAKPFRHLDRPFSDVEMPDAVTVLGLAKELSEIRQPRQRVGTIDVTTGFFTANEEITIYWSDDRSQVVADVEPRVLRSVNGGLTILGGGETFTMIPAPGPGGGTVGCVVEIETGFAPWLVTFFLVTYVALAWVPDEVVVALAAGVTVQVGRAAQAVALSAALLVMTKIGRGQYEFTGEPLEYVYKEIRARAVVAGGTDFDRNEITIENHLVNTQTDANNAARAALFLLQAQENPRDVEMLHDLKLEAGDFFEIPGGRRFLIDSVTYTLVRDATAAVRASLSVFEVTPGVVA